MSDRQRERSRRLQSDGGPADDGEGDGLEVARANADRLLQAADDAIARALSSDSERFLQAVRQSGGQ